MINRKFNKTILFISSLFDLLIIFIRHINLKNTIKINTRKILIKKFKNETTLLYFKNKSFLINPSLKDFSENYIDFLNFDYLLVSKKSISFAEKKLINFIKKKNKKITLHCPIEISKDFEINFSENEINKYTEGRKNILPIKNISVKIIFTKEEDNSSQKNIWDLEIENDKFKI